MHKAPSLLILATLFAAGCTAPGPVIQRAVVSPGGGGWSGAVQGRENFAARLLAEHNRERSAVGVPPLIWDPALAASAAVYAPIVAASGGLAHAPAALLQGQGENLWSGTRGAFSVERMVRDWASEKSMFQPGIFPNVSRTGNWTQVGHYTQIVWPGTTRVGCALHSTGREDFLVCRYSPAGNVEGLRVP